VSAESLKPAADGNDNWSPPQIPKSQDQLERLRKAIEGNFLFSHLDDEQNAQILGALAEKSIPAKDIKVCCHVYIAQ
jgi:cAMP-dependent protein kinase regulator